MKAELDAHLSETYPAHGWYLDLHQMTEQAPEQLPFHQSQHLLCSPPSFVEL